MPRDTRNCAQATPIKATPANRQNSQFTVTPLIAALTRQTVADYYSEYAEQLRSLSINLYNHAAGYAAERGLILADTKFEFGTTDDGTLLLVDEVLTSDSSRYWPADLWSPGGAQPSFDKQFVRDWLETTGWDKNSPPPRMPDDIIEKTRAKYLEAYERLTGLPFSGE